MSDAVPPPPSQQPPKTKTKTELPSHGEPVDIGNNVYMDPVYYYSRERRLSRASPIVQALNEGTPLHPGFSGGLFGSKANILLFITIILLCAMLGLVSRFTAREKGVLFGGNILTLAILWDEDVPVLGIIKNAPPGEVYMGPVDIAVSQVMQKPKEGEDAEVPPVFTHRIFFNPLESETYRISLPLEGDDFFVLLKTDAEQKTLRIRAPEKEKGK